MPTHLGLPRRCRRIVAVGLASMLLLSCSGDGSSNEDADTDDGPNRTPPPTLSGGVELATVDPRRLLAGEGIAYGTPLPSQQAAADAYLEDPEVASVVARRLYERADGRRLGDLLLLTLDGAELFDESVLDAFVAGAVGSMGDGSTTAATIEGRPVLRSQGPANAVVGYREGNQLVLVRGPDGRDVDGVVQRQLRAFAAGAVGAAEPFTPLVAIPIDAAYVPVPTVAFQPIPPPEEEPPPEAPVLPGATGVAGRYGVVAGERRTTAWAYTLDPATYPSAEALQPALAALVSGRAGGSPADTTELLGRVVVAADGTDGQPSVRAFRHQGLALVLEGLDPAQLDATLTDWLTALG